MQDDKQQLATCKQAFQQIMEHTVQTPVRYLPVQDATVGMQMVSPWD